MTRPNRMRVMGALCGLLATAALLAGCGDDGETTTTGAAPAPPPPPTVTAPKPACSAAGLSPTLPVQDLPPKVAALRDRIAAAAVACDYAELAKIANESPRGFSFTFGAETSPVVYWKRLERQGDRPLATLVNILALSPTRQEGGEYTWPAAYTERPTDAQWNELHGIYTPDEIARMQLDGTYLGYRTAITPQGHWLFFVAGD